MQETKKVHKLCGISNVSKRRQINIYTFICQNDKSDFKLFWNNFIKHCLIDKLILCFTIFQKKKNEIK